jgi:7-cyano-7-deazaguanine synthase
MALVTLVSGGLDSTLMAVLAKSEGTVQYPLFVDYGQLCKTREWMACLTVHKRYGLPEPVKMNLRGYGELVSSGLTNRSKRINEDAFLPGRNLLFLLAGSAYACEKNAEAVAIGLLDERFRMFPDQTREFLRCAQEFLANIMLRNVKLLAPLAEFTKSDVISLARKRKIMGTYSCHSGRMTPCGVCISCVEAAKAAKKES